MLTQFGLRTGIVVGGIVWRGGSALLPSQETADLLVRPAFPPFLMQAVAGLAALTDGQRLAAGFMRQQLVQRCFRAGMPLEEPVEGRLEGADEAGLYAPLLGSLVVCALPVEGDAGKALRLDPVTLLSCAEAGQ